MRYLLLLFTALVICGANVGYSQPAQPRESVQGVKVMVLDSTRNQPIEFATVSITQQGAQKPLKYGLTNQSGKAELNGVPNGSYTLKVEYMGYKTYSKNVVVEPGKRDLGTVKLMEQANLLNAVTVSAIGNPVVVKKDTVEYNASSFKTTDADVLENLLKKLPGVEIDADGKITANGKEIKKIMIDGKVFFLDDPQLATKNLPANIIEKVRVVERKSDQSRFTGFDDGNSETIIDLGIKPGMMNGWFGNISAGYGSDERFQAGGIIAKLTSKNQISAIFNGNNTNNRGFSDMAGDMMRSIRSSVRSSGGGGMRMGGGFFGGGNGLTTSWMGGTNIVTENKSGSLKVSGGYMFSNSDNFTQTKSLRQTFLQDSSFFNNQSNWSSTITNGHRMYAQLEYAFSDRTSLKFTPSVRIGSSIFDEGKTYSTYGAKGTEINGGTSSSSGNNSNQATEGELLFRHKLAKAGRTFSVNFNYSYSNNEIDGKNYSETDIFKPIQKKTIVDQQYDMNSKAYSLGARASYTEPVGKSHLLEFAYSYRYRVTTSDKHSYNFNSVTQKYDIIDSAYTNSFENTFINQQFELNIRKVTEKYNYVIGISAQPAFTKSVGDTTSFSRFVVNFSPTAMIEFDFSDTRSLRARYRGNTRQPSITQLQPVPDNSNPLFRPIGNPDLLPEFEHSLNFYYRDSKRDKFRTFEANLTATYTFDKIVNKNWYDQGGVQYSMPINEQGVYNTNGNIMFTAPFAKNVFFISTNTRAGLNKGVNYSNGLRNNTTSLSLGEQLRLTYKGKMLEASMGAGINYSNAWYTIQQKSKTANWTNSILANVIWTLPKGFNFSSDLDYRFFIGFDNNANKPSAVWNAEIYKMMFKNAATLRVKVYDILNQAKTLYRNNSDNYVEDIENNILRQYVMVSFSFRFGKFNGSNMKRPDGGGHDHGPRPGGSFGERRF